MALGEWIKGFRQLHDRAKRGAMEPRELGDYIKARDELARALIAAQHLTVPPGQRPRRALRVPRALQADIDLGVKSVRAMTFDVSAAGFGALLPSAPRVGDEAKVALRLPSAEPLRATVRVSEVKAQPGSARASFLFVDLCEDDAEKIERFVFDAVLAHLEA
jgi:c-di-GMP-binding flagellar brake protein YcgR